MQEDLEEFKKNFRESISLRGNLAKIHKIYILKITLGSLYSQKPESTARLLGVINFPNEDAAVPWTPVDKRYCVDAEAYARDVLGDEVFEAAFAKGQKMSLDEGLDLAVKMVEEI